MDLFKRSSGILLHPTSLPGPHGIGDLGPAAYRFVDFLSSTGQTWWQMLPINPPGYGESPYNTLSSFAGNPLLISLDSLVEDDLLSDSDLENFHASPSQIDYSQVRNFKIRALRQAFTTFNHKSKKTEFIKYCKTNKEWLDDFSLFQAIKENQEGRSWVDWPKELRKRNHEALHHMTLFLKEEISFYKFLQFEFTRQWQKLKIYAMRNGIRLMGDIPIFVAHDSADVWCHPKLFKLKQDGHPLMVAGVPPDYFSKTGQAWGNPVYRWSVHKKDNFSWWINRLQNAFNLFDAVRLDHFIGFYRAWEIPGDDKTAENGKWVPGPRGNFFKEVFKELGPELIVAEDLGQAIPPVHKLRKRFKFPGMFVLHFSFGDGLAATEKRFSELEKRMVVYTGTHDNNTSIGWFKEVEPPDQDRRTALEFLKSDGHEFNWDLIKLALSMKPDLAIVPLQDILGLGSESRMNHPGTFHGNWNWRFQQSDLTTEMAQRLHELTKTYKRSK